MKSLFQSAPPRTALLPSPYFFVRVLPIEAGATPTSVAEQVELALEAWAPFPLQQVYFGFGWKAGATRAVVYAAYRRRFGSEAQEAWLADEWVAPAFAPWLLREGKAGESWVLHSPEGVCVVSWSETGPVPTDVVCRPLAADASPEARAALTDEILRSLKAFHSPSSRVCEVTSTVAIEGDASGAEWVFKLDESRMSQASRLELDALDVRDRGDLAARRRSRKRDLLLWRVALFSFWTILGGLVLQGGLWGVTQWEEGREARLSRNAPEIAEINRQNELATRIEELATRRLRPFEMIDVVKERKPSSVVYRSLNTQGLNQLEISGVTSAAADLPAYRSTLSANPLIEHAEFTDQSARDGVTSFRLLVTFKPEAFKGGVQP